MRRSELRTRLTVRVATSILLAASLASAETVKDEDDDGWRWRFGPGGDLYPRFVAGPRRPMFSLTRQSIGTTKIAETGDTRYGIRLGGRYGFARFHPRDRPDLGFQLAIEGGFMGQFDVDNDTDNIAWDGIYGLHVAWAPRSALAFRVALSHDSSHVGDEYVERTGRERIRYTRQDWVAGASWRITPRWRVYGEAAYGFDLRNEELMEPWRGQAGVEYVTPAEWWSGRLGWYVATDLASYEEDDWEPNVSLQAGVRRPVDALAREYRLGVEYYAGRSLYGEFFRTRERFLAFGFWFDL